MKPEKGIKPPTGSSGLQVSGLGFQVSPPWTFLAAAAVALVIQLNPAWRPALLYDRAAVAAGEWWRVWTGHFVHFGWPHFVADTGLLVILGWLLEARHPVFSRVGLVALPAFITAALYWFDPAMLLYGGLSAVNLGLLLFLALQGWQRNWTDWFWPAVLVIYVGEVIFESAQGGRGGGMIRFDDPAVRVATSAHLASAAYALIAWLLGMSRPTKKPGPAGSAPH
ncbi:rhombosortase [Opitutus sp. GAS368]|uniref:rhombosortase n=1 Tax=Opitutus sp. GAS368 TaxID=1882749 RepID=UPI000B8671BC|nr:rhombosortase [Opitutus sp. GAS368]